MISFFFSSRRRHTRSYGDWSSDVCSSDLRRTAGLPGSRPGSRKPCSSTPPADPPISTIRWVGVGLATPRSEERRVGKESRARWGREQQKKIEATSLKQEA